MKSEFKRLLFAGVVASNFLAATAQATTGYFLHGYGARSMAMGGAGVAFPQDAIAPATNPAGIAFIGNRADGGVQVFSPKREGELNATLIGGSSSSEDSGATLFAVPNMGAAYQYSSKLSFGLSITANGGLSTRYDQNIYDQALAPAAGIPPGFLPNTGTLGVDLKQAFILPTAAFKITNNHSIGASIIIGRQTFRAYGLGDFAAFGFSSDPTKLTNNGNDKVWGIGGRVGYTGKITNWLSVGATYASKVDMEEFEDYEGLFAEKGDFDVPANYAIGVAIKPTPKLTFAIDAQRILYGDIKAINNPGPTVAEFTAPFLMQPVTRPLGTNDGFGFGWDDIWVYKFGVNYEYSNKWTLRAGFVHNQEVYDDDQVLFNILAPGLIRNHLTAGFTYSPSNNSAWTVGYMHAFSQDQDFFYDSGAILGPGTGYSAKNEMYQNAVEVGYSYLF